jgi:hypothetical protein
MMGDCGTQIIAPSGACLRQKTPVSDGTVATIAGDLFIQKRNDDETVLIGVFTGIELALRGGEFKLRRKEDAVDDAVEVLINAESKAASSEFSVQVNAPYPDQIVAETGKDKTQVSIREVVLSLNGVFEMTPPAGGTPI